MIVWVGGGGEGGGLRHDALLEGLVLPVAGDFGEEGSLVGFEEAVVVLERAVGGGDDDGGGDGGGGEGEVDVGAGDGVEG